MCRVWQTDCCFCIDFTWRKPTPRGFRNRRPLPGMPHVTFSTCPAFTACSEKILFHCQLKAQMLPNGFQIKRLLRAKGKAASQSAHDCKKQESLKMQTDIHSISAPTSVKHPLAFRLKKFKNPTDPLMRISLQTNLLSVSKAAASHQGWNFHLGLAGAGLWNDYCVCLPFADYKIPFRCSAKSDWR